MPCILVAQQTVDFSQLINRTHTERTVLLMDYYREYLRKQDSIITFNQIETVRRLATDHNDEDLMLEADLMEAHYYAYRYDPYHPVVSKTLPGLIVRAKEKNALWLESRVESLYATRFLEYLYYAQAFKHLTNAVNLLDKENPAEYPIKFICLYLLGDLHFAFREYNQAIFMFNRALKNRSEHDLEYYVLPVRNSIGLAYRQLNKLDSSDLWFHYAYKSAQEYDNAIWEVLCLGNLGENHYLKGNFSEAIPLLQQDAAAAIKRNDPGSASNALSLLGDIHLELGNIPLANQLLNDALFHARRSKEYRRYKVVFPYLVKLYAVQNKADLVHTYLDSIFIVNDSLARVFDRLILLRAEQSLKLESISKEAAGLEADRKHQLIFRNSIIALLVMLVVIVILLFNRHRIKLQSKQKSILEEKKLTETGLELAKSQLQDFVKAMQIKNAELDRTREELKRLSFAESGDVGDENIEILQSAIILTEEDWENFKLLFDKVHKGFLGRLAAKHPNISQAETRFIALTKMEINPKQMTAVLGVGDSTIRQVRSRLRRKLEIGSQEEFIQLINSI